MDLKTYTFTNPELQKKTNTNAAISKPCTYMECTYQGEPEMQQFAEKPWEGVGAVQCKGLHWGGSASIVGMKAVCAGSYWINSNCSYISAILCFWINSNCSICQLFYVSDRHSVSSQGTLTFKKVQSTTHNVYLCYACNVFSWQKIPQWLYSALFNLVLVLTVYTVNTVSNCFTLLKQKHICLNML